MAELTSSAPAGQPSVPAGPTTAVRPEPRTLRIWPAVALLAVLWGLKAIPWAFPEGAGRYFALFMFGPLACAAGLLLWWAFASRATGRERVLGFVGVPLIAAAAMLLADQSIRSFFVILNYVAPWGITAFAGTLVCLAAVRSTWRTWAALAVAAVGFGVWDVARYDGMWGDFRSVLRWRWEPTAEDRFLADLSKRSDADAAAVPVSTEATAALAAPEWPGFRGPHRDSAVTGVALDPDWKARPPKELWRKPVGPGWSSFAVAGDLLFTQEQRGETEAVVCLDAATGRERWVREYPSRFFESIGGAGPRGTPTLADGRLFALGAEGLLHRLDPLSGGVVWTRDLRVEAKREPPIWGFSSSPLVTNGAVIVHAGGEGDKGVLAFDAETGEPRWSVAAGDHSYSSPHLARVAGRDVVLMLSNRGLVAIDPATGEVAWKHERESQQHGILQPLALDESTVLIGLGMVDGTQRLDVKRDGGRVTVTERWASKDMKPDFNDFVAVGGHLYGFDGKIFACVDLETGERRWKKGRYGAGQVLALPDAGQLLVLSESGEIVLLRATPDELAELARHRVLDGKTWNHPVLVGGRLYVRNGEEAAAFELPTAKQEVAAGQ